MPLRSQLLVDQPITCPLGRITLAGIIANGPGTTFSNMRILGSYAIVYLFAGSGRYIDARGVDQKIHAGDLLTIYPEIPHAYGPAHGERWDEIYFVFDGPVFDLWRRQRILNDARPISRLEPTKYWSGQFQAVTSAATTDSALMTICLLQRLLAEMRAYEQSREMNNTQTAWIARANFLLAEQSTPERPDLNRVADQLGISYVGFRKKFARLAGISPAKFHMQSVMNRACDLMRRGATNHTIAAQLGFCDEFHFSRRFKQIVGLSPREFRQKVI